MLSIALSAPITVLEQVLTMSGVDAQPGRLVELPDSNQGMLFIRIVPTLYATLAAMGTIKVLSDKYPWEEDVYSTPVSPEDWLSSTSFI